MATYESMIAWANVRKPYQMRLINQLGKPHLTTSVDTLMVTSSVEKPGVWVFKANPEYLADKTDDEAFGLFLHEYYHIALGHLIEAVDNTNSGNTLFPNEKKFIIAHEMIVNDSVIDDGNTLPANIYTGMAFLGVTTSSMSSKEVYDLIPDDHPALKNKDDDGDCGFHDNLSDHLDGVSASDLTTLRNSLLGIVGQNPEEFQSLANKMKGISNKVKRAGTSFDLIKRYSDKVDAGEGWIKVILKVAPDFLRKYSTFGAKKTVWSNPPKRVAYMFPKVNLPTHTTLPSLKRTTSGTQKPYMALALDQSGSIPAELQLRLCELAKSIPDDIDVDCCTFSTVFVPFDYKASDNSVASGGTDFSAIDSFIDSLNRPKRPKSIVVITDGGATFTDGLPDDLDNWTWVLTHSSDYATLVGNLPQVKDENIHYLDEFF